MPGSKSFGRNSLSWSISVSRNWTFWLAASDVLVEIVQRQPDIQPIIDAAIEAGGDIEITAHNQGGKISFALAEPSGLRHVLLADASQLLQP